MSGGSFNYACFKVDSEEVFQALPDLRDMETYLRQIEKHDSADEVLLYIREVETHQRRLMKIGERIAPLLKAAEWTRSGDWSKESIDGAYQNLMGLNQKANPE
jgi:hypothetical protein